MILTFHVPPLARWQGLCDIDSPEKTEKYQKIGKSWYQDFPIFLYFSEFFWTINYRFHLTPSVQLVEAHEMSKSLNLTKIKCSLFVGTSGMFF